MNLNAKFRKELGLVDLTFASLGGIIGSGWILASMNASGVAGPGAVISWLIGGIAVLLLGLVYSELGGMLPETGGVARYPQYTHGTLVSWLMGWAAWLTYVTVAPAEAVAIVQVSGLSGMTKAVNGVTVLTGHGFLFAAVLMIIFMLVNYFGVNVFKNVNTTLTWFKLVLPATTAVLIIIVGHHFGNMTHFGGFLPNHFSASLTAVGTTGIVFSFLGFRQAIDMAGEAKNPSRDVPRALVLSIVIGIVVYVLLQIAFVVGIDPSALTKYGWAGLAKDSAIAGFPFKGIAILLGMGWLAFVLSIDGWVSPGGTGVVYTATTARLVFALAENGYLPKSLLTIHKKYAVPSVALIVNVVFGIVSMGPFPSWVQLIGFISITGFFAYIMGPIALLVLRRTAPQLKRPMVLGGANVIALLAFVVASLIIYWASWGYNKYALGAIAFGLIIYLIFLGTGRAKVQDIKSGLWLVAYIVVMALISYLGSKNFGGTNAIPQPFDTLTIVVAAIIFFYWGVASGYRTESVEQAEELQRDLQQGGQAG